METMATLKDMEVFTLDLLMKISADTAKSRLKRYFKSDNKEFFLLIDDLQSLFTELSCCQDTGLQERVIDEAYKLIAHLYLAHLIQSKQSKLSRCWSPDVGQKVADDAKTLHDTFSESVRSTDCLLMTFALQDKIFTGFNTTSLTCVLCCFRLLVSDRGTPCCRK
ncbi:uncharacterized protein si:dkey-196h17.9 [Etheostoma cragini]|uniref:uncharacterized protein si:dkey-196h17.9 n=1 Tax=Etheostoma cragini TaxID=417921 RepID=UPI00155E12F6|nr:uncharacterized protein si:dkey-196h17.9 [Etheostoma cragini]